MTRGRLPHPVVLLTLAVASVGWFVAVARQEADATPAPRAVAQDADPELVAAGRDLYRVQCSSCHGLDGQGVVAPNGDQRGPSLERSGGAAAYYYLSTGRMPLASSEEIPRRKQPAYSTDEIEALVAYVASIGDGPDVPDVDTAKGDLGHGGELFRLNCAACHSATGAGGALSYGRNAPSLSQSEPRQVGSAVRVGPGQMPRFGRETISDEELDSIASYVQYLREPNDRGGVALGRLGPIPEGMLVWIVGMGGLLLVAFAMGKRAQDKEAT